MHLCLWDVPLRMFSQSAFASKLLPNYVCMYPSPAARRESAWFRRCSCPSCFCCFHSVSTIFSAHDTSGGASQGGVPKWLAFSWQVAGFWSACCAQCIRSIRAKPVWNWTGCRRKPLAFLTLARLKSGTFWTPDLGLTAVHIPNNLVGFMGLSWLMWVSTWSFDWLVELTKESVCAHRTRGTMCNHLFFFLVTFLQSDSDCGL